MIIYALIFSEAESPNSPRAISSKLRLVGKPTPASYNLKSKSDIEGKNSFAMEKFCCFRFFAVSCAICNE